MSRHLLRTLSPNTFTLRSRLGNSQGSKAPHERELRIEVRPLASSIDYLTSNRLKPSKRHDKTSPNINKNGHTVHYSDAVSRSQLSTKKCHWQPKQSRHLCSQQVTSAYFVTQYRLPCLCSHLQLVVCVDCRTSGSRIAGSQAIDPSLRAV